MLPLCSFFTLIGTFIACNTQIRGLIVINNVNIILSAVFLLFLHNNTNNRRIGEWN